MQINFESNLMKILKASGYERIELPMPAAASESQDCKICLMGKLSGSVAYYYVVYGVTAAQLADYAAKKTLVDHIVAHNSKRLGIRHSVVFNIFAGDLSGDVRKIEKMIDSQGEFTMMEKYDVYYGADTVGMRIMRNKQQPHNMDGALGKIERAMKGTAEVKSKGVVAKAKKTAELTSSRYAVPVAKHPILCYIIMSINAVVFLLMELSGGSASIPNLMRFGAASYHLVFTYGEYWRLLASTFIHIGFMHLLFNTAFLIILATRAERYFGHVKFAVIYLASGILSSVASTLINEFSLGAGASGALFGAMGALVAFMLLRKKYVENLSVGALGMMIAVNILMGFAINQFGMPDMPNIGNVAHIGGLVSGLGLGYLLTGRSNVD